MCQEKLTRDVLIRHFQATKADDVVGAHPLPPGDGGAGRWVGTDFDCHDGDDDPVRNREYALCLYGILAGLGFRPLLVTWGTGGYHLWVFFASDVPGPVLFAFGKWLVKDAKDFGYPKEIEAFPKQMSVPAEGCGNWLRVPGRHHTKDMFALVFDGREWVEGEDAVSHILSLTGDSPDLIPDAARPQPEQIPEPPEISKAGGTPARHATGGPDIFEEYNRTVPLDTVVRWHTDHGHKVTASKEGRVELLRDGKEGSKGQSFNVQVINGAPITYNFSPKSGMPEQTALSPAQVRCLYETGTCHTAAMRDFAGVLRRELSVDTGEGPGANGTHKNGNEAAGKAVPDLTGGGGPGPAAVGSAEPEGPEHTDSGNALEFAKDHAADVRWTQSHGWLVWDGRRWKVDDTLAVVERGKATAARLLAEAAAQFKAAAAAMAAAAESEDEKAEARSQTRMKRAKAALANGKYCRQRKGLEAMLALARSLPGIATTFDQFDRHHQLFNVLNGTLDLRTATLREHRKEDQLTRLAPVEYDLAANAPAFERFLASTFAGDAALIAWLHAYLGSCLTGETRDELLVVFWGSGSNGKSKLIELLLGILGDHAWKAPAEILLARKNDAHPEERASLCGRRFVACAETDQGRRLNEGLVKELTGSDTMNGRFMHKNSFTFWPTWKLVLATNYRPQIRGQDHGIWRRVRLVPFTQRFWKPDEPAGPAELKADLGLSVKLWAERSGILTWLVMGAAKWYADGLPRCRTVEQSTAEYRSAEDLVQQFVDQRVEVVKGGGTAQAVKTKGRDFYAAFKKWHEDEGMPGQPMTGTAFGTRFSELAKSMGATKNDKTAVYSGVQLRDLYSDDRANAAGGSWGS